MSNRDPATVREPGAQRHQEIRSHQGPCGQHVRCWRARCQTTWNPYRPVEILTASRTGRVLAVITRCHPGPTDPLDLPVHAEAWLAAELRRLGT
jgi:hypothetical protein